MSRGEVTFVFSGVVRKNEKSIVSVRFERKNGMGMDYAEGQIPDCRIDRQCGFTEDEITQMEAYLREEKFHIIEEARKLNNIKRLLS